MAAVTSVVVAGLVAVILDAERWLQAIVILLLGAAVVLLIDLRRRSGEVSHALRRAVDRDRALARQVAALSGYNLIDRRLEALTEAVGAPIQRALGPDGQLEQMERRFLGAFEAERLRAADRQRELEGGRGALAEMIARQEAALADSRVALTRGQERAVKELTQVARDETRQVEALLQLVPALEQRRALLPPSGRWAMDARSIGHLMDLVRARHIQLAVELGSGTSSIWLGYQLEKTGGRLVSVEHESEFAEMTRTSVQRHGLADTVEVRLAPLVDLDTARWYDTAELADLTAVDLLVVDGPPGSVGRRARAYALPFFLERLAPDALVILDDSNRPDEVEIVRDWISRYNLERIETGMSRLAVLRRRTA